MPTDTSIRIVAFFGGRDTVLATAEIISGWFAEDRPGAIYTVEFDGHSRAIPGIVRNGCELIRSALASFPGYAPQPGNKASEWTVFDNFTRAHCGTLAIALASTLDAQIVSVCRVDPDACGDEPEGGFDPNIPPAPTTLADLEWSFAHAGVLLADDTVLCPAGRTDRHLWSVQFAQVETDFTTSITDPEMLRNFVAEPTPAILRIVPAVAGLIAMLADPRFA